MKTEIQNMKQELKQLAKEIKELKSKRSAENNGYVYGLLELRRKFRHKHVAYCLVRGRKLEQVDSGNGLDMDHVNWIISSMKKEDERKHKLYVVVNKNLTPGQQAVQSGHAVAEFLRKNPNTQWSNGYLIYLKDSPDHQGNMRCYYKLNHEYAEFAEPDLNNKVTAYAVFGYCADNFMKNKELL